MSNPFVSICIPTYNGALYLKECLESCIHQNYSDYEIIICDDGSTDATVAIVNSYCLMSDKIKLSINNSNLGLVGNWNRCIDLAKGDWIKFVFQDDFISTDCLSEFVRLITPNTKLMVSERDFILEANAAEEIKFYYQHTVRTLKNTSSHADSYYSPELISKLAIKNMSMNFIAEPSLSFFKKEVLIELGKFRPELKQICDLEFVLRIASVYGLTLVPKKLCSFRIHPQTTTNSNMGSNFYQLKYIEPVLLAYFLLYDPSFENFRRHCNVWENYKLKTYFKFKAHLAYLSNKDYPLFDDKHTQFKEIESVKKGNLFIRILVRLFRK